MPAAFGQDAPPKAPASDSAASEAEPTLPKVEPPPTAPAQPPATEIGNEALTLEAVEQLALANNPTLMQAQARVSGAQGGWVQAGLYPNPEAGYQGSEIGNNGAAGQQGFFISQEVVTAGKLRLSRHTAVHEIGRLQAEWAAQQYRVQTSVRTAFYDLLVAQESVRLTERLLAISEGAVEAAEALLEARQGNRIDLLQARVEMNQSRVAVRKARNHREAAAKQLAALIGVPGMKVPAVRGESNPDIEAVDFETMLARIIATSPEFVAAQHKIARTSAAVARARVEPIPNVDLQAGAQYDYSTDYTVANLQVSVPVPIRNRNQGNIQKAEAEWIAASRDLERLQLQIEQRLAGAFERYANASYEVERYRESILPDASSSLDLVEEIYEQGEIDYLRLLTAQRTNFQTQVDYLNAVREWWTAKLEIDGLLLVGGLDAPSE
ncbi:MAG: TolC family protein [Planctomycetaceae bacterium]